MRARIEIKKNTWGDERWDWLLFEGKAVVALNEISFKTKKGAIKGFLRAKRLFATAEIKEEK